MLSAGFLLGNRYRLEERIATGGMGEVWKGTDVVLGRVIAVKVLKTAMLSDPEFSARFYGEARMMASFRHPGVVEVYDYAGADDASEERVAYLVMAYVEGEPLSARVRQGPMPVTDTMSIVAQAADALHAAHEVGVVHRDVKPGNLIVRPTGAVVLVDFGVARSAAVTSVTALNAIVGTALYMAPEQVAKGNVTPATDIYALGAVAYHCLAGNPPFDGDNALQVALRHLEDDPEPLPPNIVPPAVRELIARAMAKQPEDRFASAAEFAEAALAAAGTLDWRAQTGTSMTGTGLRRPAMPNASTGTALGAGALGGAGLHTTGTSQPGLSQTGMSLSGASLTRPMSPAAPRRTMAGQRNLLEAAPVPQAPVRRKGRTRNELAVLLSVIGLFVLAGGLALAIAFNNKSADAEQTPNSVVPANSTEATDETEAPPTDEQTTTPVRPANPLNPGTPKASRSPSPSRTPSPSASTSVSPTPPKTTTKPPDLPPTTVPPTTVPPTTVPPDPTDPVGGGGNGAGQPG